MILFPIPAKRRFTHLAPGLLRVLPTHKPTKSSLLGFRDLATSFFRVLASLLGFAHLCPGLGCMSMTERVCISEPMTDSRHGFGHSSSCLLRSNTPHRTFLPALTQVETQRVIKTDKFPLDSRGLFSSLNDHEDLLPKFPASDSRHPSSGAHVPSVVGGPTATRPDANVVLTRRGTINSVDVMVHTESYPVQGEK